MLFLAAGPDITPLTDLINNWIHIGQALVGSIGALAFIFALACMPITLPSRWWFSDVSSVQHSNEATNPRMLRAAPTDKAIAVHVINTAVELAVSDVRISPHRSQILRARGRGSG